MPAVPPAAATDITVTTTKPRWTEAQHYEGHHAISLGQGQSNLLTRWVGLLGQNGGCQELQRGGELRQGGCYARCSRWRAGGLVLDEGQRLCRAHIGGRRGALSAIAALPRRCH